MLSGLSPELIQILLTAGSFLAAWWLRGKGITLPVLGPKPADPKPVVPPKPPDGKPDLLDLLRQLEPLLPLLLKLVRSPAHAEAFAGLESAPEPRLYAPEVGPGSVIRVAYEIPPLLPRPQE